MWNDALQSSMVRLAFLMQSRITEQHIHSDQPIGVGGGNQRHSSFVSLDSIRPKLFHFPSRASS